MLLGFLIAGLISAFQADQSGQRGAIRTFQTQGRIGRIMALLFAVVIIIVALQFETAEDTLHDQRLSALACLPCFGLIRCIDAVGASLKKIGHQRIGRFEHRRAQQYFHFLEAESVALLGFDPVD